MKYGFDIYHVDEISIKDEEYYLHTHKTMHEILLFVAGDCDFRAEASSYPLEPFDLVLASNNEMHRIVHRTETRYERYVINIDTDFFAKNACFKFSGVFEDKAPGAANHIPHKTVMESGMYDAVVRMCRYFEEEEFTVAKAALIELLYMLGKCTPSVSGEAQRKEYISEIVSYINDNLTRPMTLASLSELFHISESQLARAFKARMKMPLKKYIAYKRLLLASELVSGGKTMLEASLEAGFSDYSSFYRQYKKEFGSSPKNELKKRGSEK